MSWCYLDVYGPSVCSFYVWWMILTTTPILYIYPPIIFFSLSPCLSLSLSLNSIVWNKLLLSLICSTQVGEESKKRKRKRAKQSLWIEFWNTSPHSSMSCSLVQVLIENESLLFIFLFKYFVKVKIAVLFLHCSIAWNALREANKREVEKEKVAVIISAQPSYILWALNNAKENVI